jgi:hypothetical protein
MYEQNRIIVNVSSRSNLVALAKEMLNVAEQTKIEDKPDYLENTPEGRKQLKKEAEDPQNLRFARFFIANPFGLLVENDNQFLCYSVVLTHDKYDGTKEYMLPDRWHLSISCRPMLGSKVAEKHIRLSDAMSQFIAEVFLGKGFKEIPREGQIIKEVRHFVASGIDTDV